MVSMEKVEGFFNRQQFSYPAVYIFLFFFVENIIRKYMQIKKKAFYQLYFKCLLNYKVDSKMASTISHFF